MAKQSCLIVLSASSLGVSAPSFLQCYKLTQSAFNIEIATPEAAAAVFIDKDDQSTRWLNDIAAKKLLEPHSLSDIQGSQYSCVVIPHSPGASEDLATCEALGNILSQCLAEKIIPSRSYSNKLLCIFTTDPWRCHTGPGWDILHRGSN
ncbi:hypothetical protein OTU49_005505 [Cherax quadricarinatus]|uniref:Uncharacterized protein n=1 Tax=Cherax quadricarinatus TaxID=27406 RepID=A0AAW0X5E6_CHEQU